MSRTSLTVKDRLNLLADYKNGMGKDMLALKYNCVKSTVWRTIRNEDSIREMGQNMNLKRKRNRKSVHQDVEDALNIWVKEEQEQKRNLTGDIVLQKAQEIATSLNSDFIAKPTWVWRWSKRVNVKFSRLKKSDDTLSGDEGCGTDVKPMEYMNAAEHSEDDTSDHFHDYVEEVNMPTNQTDVFSSKTELIDETTDWQDNNKTNTTDVTTKHSWLSSLVASQMEEIHPDDRSDFAWEVHKLIRKYQMKKKTRQRSDV